jgi:hypothetical protein
MRSFLFSASALVAANVAVANIIPVMTAAAHDIKTVYEAPHPTAFARRDEDDKENTFTDIKSLEKEACSHLVELSLMMGPLPDQQLFENVRGTDACSATVPATLSNEMKSYVSEMSEWFETIDDKAAKTTDCGIDDFRITLHIENMCTESYTVFYTDSDEKTVTSVYEPFPTIKDNVLRVGDDSGASPRSIGMIGATVALAGVVSMILTL